MSAKILSFHEIEIDQDDTPLDCFLDVEFDDASDFDTWQIVDA